jgi:hypothetical protein
MKIIETYIKAGQSGIAVTTHEEARAELVIASIAKTLGYRFFLWSCTQGLVEIGENGGGGVLEGSEDPMAMLERFMGQAFPDKSIVIARDFHPFLGRDASPVVIRKLRDALQFGKQSQRVIIPLGCSIQLPPELEKEMAVVTFELPTRVELRAVLESIAESAGMALNEELMESLVNAASGMTTTEAEGAFAVSFADRKSVV